MLQKKGNYYYIVLNVKNNETGKWIKKWIPTKTQSRREAKKIENDLLYKVDMGLLKAVPEKEVPILSIFLKNWLEICIKPPLRKPSTYENYIYVVNKVTKQLGSMKINLLTPEHIERYMNNELRHGTSHTVMRLILRVLKVAFKAAVKWKLISINPCENVVPPSPTKSPSMAADVSDIKRLLEITKEDSNPINHVIICLGALVGLRKGEMCALEWKDVDFENNILNIRHSMARRSNHLLGDKKYYKVFKYKNSSIVLDDVKTDASASSIYIPQIAMDALLSMKKWQSLNQNILKSCYMDNDLVLCFEDGRPCEPNYVYRRFKKLLIANGLPEMRVHDLRHTAATLLLIQGVDIKLVSHQLRHSDVTITQNLYQHVTDTLAQKSAIAMDKLFTNNK